MILKLEDDVTSNDGFLTEIHMFINRLELENRTRWIMLEFSHLGFIGKLIRTKDLPKFVSMFLMYSNIKPVDQIHNIVFEAIACNPEKHFGHCKKNFEKLKVSYKNSLFQHVGFKSSLKGKIQRMKV